MSARLVAEINEERRRVREAIATKPDALAWACAVMRPAELDGLR